MPIKAAELAEALSSLVASTDPSFEPVDTEQREDAR